MKAKSLDSIGWSRMIRMIRRLAIKDDVAESVSTVVRRNPVRKLKGVHEALVGSDVHRNLSSENM